MAESSTRKGGAKPPGVPAVGAKAPPFRLPASTGETVDLKDVTAKGPVVLFFYPKADTPGCTTQACGVRDHLPAYEDAGAVVSASRRTRSRRSGGSTTGRG